MNRCGDREPSESDPDRKQAQRQHKPAATDDLSGRDRAGPLFRGLFYLLGMVR